MGKTDLRLIEVEKSWRAELLDARVSFPLLTNLALTSNSANAANRYGHEYRQRESKYCGHRHWRRECQQLHGSKCVSAAASGRDKLQYLGVLPSVCDRRAKGRFGSEDGSGKSTDRGVNGDGDVGLRRSFSDPSRSTSAAEAAGDFLRPAARLEAAPFLEEIFSIFPFSYESLRVMRMDCL